MHLSMSPCAPLLAASTGSAAGCRCSGTGNQNGVVSLHRHLRTASAVRLQPCRAAATDAAAAANGSRQPVRPDTSAAALLNAFDGLDSGGSKQLRDFCEIAYLSGRTKVVQDHFPMALGAQLGGGDRCLPRAEGVAVPDCSFAVGTDLHPHGELPLTRFCRGGRLSAPHGDCAVCLRLQRRQLHW